MAKVTAQEIIDLGFIAEMFDKAADSEVIGTDGLNYRCKLDHIAADTNKPVTGASWATYWEQAGFKGVAWVTATNYKCQFSTFITGIISEQAIIGLARIGAVNYAAAISPMQDYVKLAEKCLCAVELCKRRINKLLANVTGAGEPLQTTDVRNQMKTYNDQADELVKKILAGGATDSGSDIAISALVTDHFGGSNA